MTSRKEEGIIILKIPGMNESGRAQRLRRAVEKLDGVFQVDINYIRDVVTIKYDANRLTATQVKKKLDSSEAP
jgi:copper chaperone CopZ